jgi:hypothetical protein
MRNERRKKGRGTCVGRRGKREGVYDIMPHLLLSLERFGRREKDWKYKS